MNARHVALGSLLALPGCSVSQDARPDPLEPHVTRSFAAVARRAAAERQAPVRSLGEAVELCLARSPDLDEADASIRAAGAELERARAALWPAVGAELSATWADAPSVYLFKTIDAGRLAPNTDFNDPGSLRNTEAGLAARWNLWRGGRDERAIRAAESGLEANRAAEDATRNALIGAVASAWLELLATRELGLSDDARVRTLDGQLADARARLRTGAALEVDVLSLEVRRAQAVERRTRTELGRKLALAALRHLAALDDATPIEPDERALPEPELPGSREQARAAAAGHRSELSAGRADLASARARVEEAERAWAPRLDLLARVWGDESDISLDLQRTNSSLSLVLSADVLDGGMRSAGRSGARAELLAADARLRRSELAIDHEVDRAWFALEEARAQLAVAEHAEQAAVEALDLVSKQLAAGATTVSRYLDADADQAQARAQLVLARIQVMGAALELRRAVGTLQGVTW